MDKTAEIKIFNDAFVESIKEGNVKDAAVSLQTFTRNVLREESFAEKILTPLDITNEELDKSEDPELLVKWCDREPDTAPAVTIPLGAVPDGLQFKGTRYPVYMTRVTSPLYQKDIDKLRGYDYDIRQVMLELSTKEIATELDTRFIDKVNAVVGAPNTANTLNGMGLPQYVTISGGINRTNLVEAFKTITRLRVPFGPMQPDGASSKGAMLCNNVTAMDLLRLERGEVGGDLSEKMFVDGAPPTTILGVKTVFTLKRSLIPDGVIYLFSAEDFFGKYVRLQPLTCWLENKAFFTSFLQYMSCGIAIGNTKSVVRCDFL